MTKTTTVHLRIPLALKEKIAKRADAERRTWTQMAVLMLEDAAVLEDPPMPKGTISWSHGPGRMPSPRKRQAVT